MTSLFSSAARRPRVVSAIGLAASPSTQTEKKQSLTIVFYAKHLAVVLAAGLALCAGSAKAGIVSLAAPFTLDGNFGSRYLTFDGTSLTDSGTQGANGIFLENVFGDLVFGPNWAYNSSTSGYATYSQGQVVSAATTDFSSSNTQSQPSASGLTYYVLGFYNNTAINSFPSESDPNDDFIANANLAWVAVSRDGSNITVEAAGINTVPGGSVTVGVVPEPCTYAMALAGLACGCFSMWRRRKRA